MGEDRDNGPFTKAYYVLYNTDKKERLGVFDVFEIEKKTGFSKTSTKHFLQYSNKTSGVVRFSERLKCNVTCRKDDKSRRRIS